MHRVTFACAFSYLIFIYHLTLVNNGITEFLLRVPNRRDTELTRVKDINPGVTLV